MGQCCVARCGYGALCYSVFPECKLVGIKCAGKPLDDVRFFVAGMIVEVFRQGGTVACANDRLNILVNTSVS